MKRFAKFLLQCVATFWVATSVSAQDIIIMNNDNADELKVKVIEVQDDVVKYKKWTYQDGPTFVVATKDIFVIKYQNGDKQRFDRNSQKDSSPKTEQVVAKAPEQEPKSVEPVAKPDEPAVKLEEDEEKKEEEETVPSDGFNRFKYYPSGTDISNFEATYYFPTYDYPDGWAFSMAFDLTYGRYVFYNLYVDAGLGVLVDTSSSGIGNSRTSTTSTALSIPTNVGYKFPIVENVKLDIKTGLRPNYCVAGKIEYGDEKIRFSELGNVERFSLSWGFTVGVDLWGFTVGTKYLLDLTGNRGDMIGLYIGWTM